MAFRNATRSRACRERPPLTGRRVPLTLFGIAFCGLLPPQLRLLPAFAFLLFLSLGTWIDGHRSLRRPIP